MTLLVFAGAAGLGLPHAAGEAAAAPGKPPATQAALVPSAAARALPVTVKDFVANHCADCHDGDGAKGGLDLSSLAMDPDDPVALRHWTRVLDRARDGEMPPKRKARPAAADLAAFLTGLGDALRDADADRQARQGRVRGRRLTRVEYENTVADLLGVRLPLRDVLPEDARTHAFDTVAAGQDVSPQLLERYQAAAEDALDAALQRATVPEKPWSVDLTPAEFARKRTGVNARDPVGRGAADGRTADAVAWSTNLPFHGRMPPTAVPADGWYRVRVNAFAVNPPADGIVWASLQSGFGYSNNPTLYWVGSLGAGREPRDFVYEAWIRKGHLLELRPNDGTVRRFNYNQFVDSGKAEGAGVAGVAIRSVSLEAIPSGPPADRVRRQLFGDLAVTADGPVSAAPAADAARLMRAFAARAFRRPVGDAELRPYVGVAEAALADGLPFARALRAGYLAVLCSPRFLYLQERPGRLDDHALACRLSYLFWSTAPDEALRAAADAGRLGDPAELHAQVERMLGDPRSRAFVEHFTDQWLNLRDIGATQPDPKLYPEFDPVLQQSMLDETRGFFAELLNKDLGVANFVDSDFAMLDARLAKHYGLPAGAVGPGGVRPVPLRPEWRRGGLLGQAAVHKVTANGTTTSPILRGVWVLERLLGQHVPPPPTDVPAVEPDIRGATTIRQQLEKHRAAESCAACHVKIDPPGFALESYDVIGRWRDRYRVVGEGGRKSEDGPAVDASYQTADGRPFEDVAAYKALLLRDREQIARCLAEKILVYGTGADASFADRLVIDEVVARTRATDFGLRSIVHAVVQSRAFTHK